MSGRPANKRGLHLINILQLKFGAHSERLCDVRVYAPEKKSVRRNSVRMPGGSHHESFVPSW